MKTTATMKVLIALIYLTVSATLLMQVAPAIIVSDMHIILRVVLGILSVTSGFTFLYKGVRRIYRIVRPS